MNSISLVLVTLGILAELLGICLMVSHRLDDALWALVASCNFSMAGLFVAVMKAGR